MKQSKMLLAVLAIASVLTLPASGVDTIDRATQKMVAGTANPNEPVIPPQSIFAHGLLDYNNNVLLDAWAGTLRSRTNLAWDLSGSVTTFKFPLGDVTIAPPSSGGNLGAANTLNAVVNSKLVPFGTIANGTTETVAYMEAASATSAVTVGVAPTDTDDTAYARIGADSIKLAWPTTAVAGDGVSDTVTSDNLEADESIGFWFRSSEVLAAGDLTLVLTDDGGARTFNIPAVTAADKWVWLEVDITSLAAGTGDAVTAVKILLSSAGATAHGAFNTWVDGMYKWDAADELAVGADLIDQPGAVRSFLLVVKADAGTTAHTITAATEDTDFFVHTEAGNDFLVPITNLSTYTGFALVYHE